MYTLLVGTPPPSAKERFLRPHLLRPPELISPGINPTVSKAIMWSLEMHPDRRPRDTEMMRAALLGEIQPHETDEMLNGSTPEWLQAIQENRPALILAAVLFIVAIIITVT